MRIRRYRPAATRARASRIVRSTALPAIALAAAMPAGAQDATEQRLEASRAITAEFTSRLQNALQSAMTAGGPAAAITICQELAPQIASELSRMSGAKVQRTSLRFRNPANAPEPWQSEVLRAFDQDAAQAAEPGGLEHWAATDGAGSRYMRAIPTGGLCLMCHGSAIPPEVEMALDEHYPHDLARGYALGDIRGAFSVTWPAISTGPE